MTPERWKKVEEVFDAVLERAPSERRAFLATACAGDDTLLQQVEALIKSYEAAGTFIEEPVAGGVVGLGVVSDASLAMIGRRIGSYRLAREIGRGGMGAVYLAVRADDEFQKRVAIKLVKRGMDTDFILRRFRQERQILASLDHQNIARLLDGGTTDDGLPYFVMEYIQGLPITSFCDGQKLSTTDRLRLFAKVCAAVHHAHQNLVIHRDLKPSNVLVTPDGTPKLLDFGIAKLLNPEMGAQTLDPTTVAMRLMTPEYASPEQVRGDIVTMTSDVYSMGVLLYELLTGHRPYRLRNRNAEELARIICDEEPERPSVVINLIEVLPSNGSEPTEITPATVVRSREESLEKLRRQLANGLDNIVLKALRKEPQRRYQTAEEFADDIQRYLSGIPVLAPAFFPLPAPPSKIDTGETSTGPKSIAVLPFKTLRTEAATDEYLGMGMADALITKLSNIRRIVVRPTSSIIKYFDGEQNAVIAGHELNVDFILDGRVQRITDRVRVTVQLVRVSDGAPLWAEKFDEKFTDIFTVEDSISEQVAQALMPRLSGEEIELLRKRDTESADAYQAYLKGRYFWNKFTDEGFSRALEHFKEAIQLDPGYALAYVGLADYLTWAAIFGMGAPREYFPQAKAAALQALELNDSLAEAHAALAFTTLCYDWDARLAEKQFKQALELSPNYALAHQWYSNLLAAQGRFDEAITEIKRAQELNPLSLMDRSIGGWTYYHARQYENAMSELAMAMELDRGFGNVHMMMGIVQERMGQHEQAIGTLRRALELMDGSIVPLWALGYTLGAAGRRLEAQEILEKLKRLSQQSYVSPYFLALIYTGLGDKDAAFAWLETAYQNREEWLIWLGTEPKLDSLRTDPRFSSLLRRVGIYLPELTRARQESGGNSHEEFFIDTEKIPTSVAETGDPAARHDTDPVSGPISGSAPVESATRFGDISSPSPRRIGDEFIKSSANLRRIKQVRTNWPRTIVPIALLLIAVLAFGIYKFLPRAGHIAQFDNIRTIKLTTNGTATDAAISPDGKYVVYTIEEAGKQGLWGRQVAIGNSIKLIGSSEADYRGLAFSRDGVYVYYVVADKDNKRTLFQMPALGGSPRKLLENVDSPVGVSPTGDQLAFVRTNQSQGEDLLMISAADGSNARQIASRKFPQHFSISSAPAWTPDGSAVAVVVESSDANGFFMNVTSIRPDDGSEKPIVSQRWLEIGQIAWLSDSSGLIMSAQDVNSNFLQLVSVSYPDGAVRKITSDLSDYKGPSMPVNSGELLAVQRQTLTNIWISQKGQSDRTTQLTSGAGRYFDISWTADSKILYASDANGSADIWQMEADGTEQRQLTAGAFRNYGPVASPDGRFLLCHSNRSGSWQIWRMDRDGSNPVQLTNGKEQSNWAQVTPDGRWIIYEHVGEGSLASLWKVPIEGGTPVRLTAQLSMRASISRDGKLVAYWQKEQSPGALWRIAIVPTEAGGTIKSFSVPQSPTNGNTGLRWTPDGSSIIFMDYRDGITSFWAQPIDGSAPRKISEVANNQIYAFDVDRDGRYIFSRGLRTNDVVLITDSHR